jgi:TRAP-type mannitol/chloroaromatic compound transport system permease small subunit
LKAQTKLWTDIVTASAAPDRQHVSVVLSRLFAWAAIAATFAFLVNNYLTFWQEWPGPSRMFSDGGLLAWVQAGLYVAAIAIACVYVLRTPSSFLRPDARRIYSITAFVVRVAFWAVVLIGLADMVVSFLRVENLLPTIFGDSMATDLGRSSYRGFYVHFPMLALAIFIALFHRGLGFPWLALLVVGAELLIVLTRFIFSYEQAFMSDLVRFWYAALFLFASAYTLIEEGHVRVDVLYSSFDDQTKGMVNAIGSLLLGIPVCLVIIDIGMSSKSAIINGPLLIFETTQTGFGMYVKYWMAGFLGVFAISMLIQFVGFFLEGIADFRDEPNKRIVEPPSAH